MSAIQKYKQINAELYYVTSDLFYAIYGAPHRYEFEPAFYPANKRGIFYYDSCEMLLSEELEKYED